MSEAAAIAREPAATTARVRALALTAALAGWLFDGAEMGLYPLVARPALRALLGADAATAFGAWNAAIIAAFLVGAAVGGVLFGWLGDRHGRMRALTWSVLVYSLGSGLCCVAQSPVQLASLRGVAALGMGGEWALGVALVMECWPSERRPLLAGVIGAAGNAGFLAVALVGLALGRALAGVDALLAAIGVPGAWRAALQADGGWRALMLVSAAPALITLVVRLAVPESERWKRAAATAAPPRVREILAARLRARTWIGCGLAGVALIGTWATVQNLPSWADRLSGGAPGARANAQIASAAGAVIGTLLAAALAARIGRRAAYAALCAASLLVSAVMFRGGFAYGATFLALCALLGAVTAGFYGWLPLYLPELFPTRLRATGQGTCYNAGRILAAVGAFAGGWLLDHFGEDYGRMGAIMSLVYALGLALAWAAPETAHEPLPE